MESPVTSMKRKIGYLLVGFICLALASVLANRRRGDVALEIVQEGSLPEIVKQRVPEWQAEPEEDFEVDPRVRVVRLRFTNRSNVPVTYPAFGGTGPVFDGGVSSFCSLSVPCEERVLEPAESVEGMIVTIAGASERAGLRYRYGEPPNRVERWLRGKLERWFDVKPEKAKWESAEVRLARN